MVIFAIFLLIIVAILFFGNLMILRIYKNSYFYDFYNVLFRSWQEKGC